jgi:serine/threonine protein kinase
MALSVGTQLGAYTVTALIGKGGMGEVCRARDTRLNRDVAIKVSDVRFSERFEREARAIAALSHPNICHLYDVGPDYLVMELVEGSTLAEKLKSGGRFGCKKRWRLPGRSPLLRRPRTRRTSRIAI